MERVSHINAIIILLFLGLIFMSCHQESPISGTVNGISDTNYAQTIYLIEPQSVFDVASSYMGTVIDSAKINNDGTFRFEQIQSFPDEVLLELAIQRNGENFLNNKSNDSVDIMNYIPIIYKEGENIQLTTEASNFYTNAIVNSSISAQNELNQLYKLHINSWKEHHKEIKQLPGDENIIKRQESLFNYQKGLMKFAMESKFFLPAIQAIRWISPNKDYERVSEIFDQQCKKWESKEIHHTWHREICQYAASQHLPLQVGDTIPDIKIPLLDGREVSIHSLLGKKLTVIDFWASWCAPCRIENRKYLTPIYRDNHTKGLEIIAYGLETEKDTWQKAIDKDGAHIWIHASHLQGDEAPLMKSFKIVTIPANFIVNQEGIIIAKNVNGEHLRQYITEYLK